MPLVLSSHTATAGNSSVPSNPHVAVDDEVIDASDYNSVHTTIINELSNIGKANIIADGVAASEIEDGTVTYAEHSALLDTHPYNYSNLKINSYSSSSQAVITADHVALQNPDSGQWITVKSISITLAPTTGVAALNGQATTFAVSTGHYYVWIIAKSDASSPRAILSSSSVIATVQDEAVAIDATYTYVGLYGALTNQAVGSYDLQNQAQVGAHVSLMEDNQIVSLTSSASNTSQAAASFMPTGIASLADVKLEVNGGTSNAGHYTSQLLTLQGESGAGTLARAGVADNAGQQMHDAVVFPDYRVVTSVYYNWTRSDDSTANISIVGYTIDHLAR